MKAYYRDPEVLKRISPNQLAAYLQEKGWLQESYIEKKASIWVIKNGNEEEEVLLPLNANFRDYSFRISEILKTLESIEQRPQDDIFNNLIGSLSDVIKIRLTHEDFSDGTVPLNNGLNLVRYARDMMLSAACSTVESKKHFEKKKPSEANDYLKEARFGQTKKGSFILTIISPINSLNSPEAPFERKVVEKLFKSLKFIKTIAENIDVSKTDLDLPEDYLESGISSNLCEALTGIYKSGREKGIDLDLSWSSGMPAPTDILTSLVFPPEIMPAVSKIGKRLKADIISNYEIVGEVVKLERQNQESKGQVTLMGKIDGGIKRIKVDLPDAEYRVASQANQDRASIVGRGDLVKEGRLFSLTNLTSFSLA